MKFKITLQSTRRTPDYPLPVVGASGKQHGVALYQPRLNASRLTVEVSPEQLPEISLDLTLGAERPGMYSWYICAIEVLDNAGEREHELATELDKAQAELSTLQGEVANLSTVAAERLDEITGLRAQLAAMDAEGAALSAKASGEEPVNIAQEQPAESGADDQSTTEPTATVEPAGEPVLHEESPDLGGDSRARDLSKSEPESPTWTREKLQEAGGVRALRSIAKAAKVPGYKNFQTEPELIEAILAHAPSAPSSNG